VESLIHVTKWYQPKRNRWGWWVSNLSPSKNQRPSLDRYLNDKLEVIYCGYYFKTRQSARQAIKDYYKLNS
jgi:hypothetical protein